MIVVWLNLLENCGLFEEGSRVFCWGRCFEGVSDSHGTQHMEIFEGHFSNTSTTGLFLGPMR
jgi:hypothetical protein